MRCVRCVQSEGERVPLLLIQMGVGLRRFDLLCSGSVSVFFAQAEHFWTVCGILLRAKRVCVGARAGYSAGLCRTADAVLGTWPQ